MAQTRASNRKVLVLAGDGIGPEIMRQALRVIEFFDRRHLASFDIAENSRPHLHAIPDGDRIGVLLCLVRTRQHMQPAENDERALGTVPGG